MAVKLTDNRKVFKSAYQQKPGTIEIVEIPDLKFLVLEGVNNIEVLEKEHKLWFLPKIQNQLRSITSNKLTYNFRQMPFEIEWDYSIKAYVRKKYTLGTGWKRKKRFSKLKLI